MSTMTLNPTRELRFGRDLPVAARPGSGSSSVRLTRRGRVVVVAAILLTVLVLGVFFGSRSVATDEAGSPAPTEVVMVGQGDTLWGIASEIAADGDVPSVMSEIKRLNALDSGMLTLGQKLRIPLAD
ncbi:LysM peptidoglycan-binding domain-containing protein [Nocardioides sp. 616]|uniref:LysM peptidoglycan-binding domain-containing protein n=1 Tax=Nocardioides sp. 616 TaxID=2268090 RepID=UPI000CE3E3A6|nr:LysM peptidoglycan-binding domain-containing protein [Nocardioides sp. 616]